jgi:hypothetical protein
VTACLHGLSYDLELWSRFTVAEQIIGGGSSCSAPRLRNDVAYVKADFISAEFTAGFWYLSVVSGAKRTPIKTSNNKGYKS